MFSTQENAAFTVVNRFGESFDVTTLLSPPARSRSPPFRGGVGVGLCCHLPPCCHHRHVSETQWFREVGGRVAANFMKKKFFSRKTSRYPNMMDCRALKKNMMPQKKGLAITASPILLN
jgi:hypothetical protein